MKALIQSYQILRALPLVAFLLAGFLSPLAAKAADYSASGGGQSLTGHVNSVTTDRSGNTVMVDIKDKDGNVWGILGGEFSAAQVKEIKRAQDGKKEVTLNFVKDEAGNRTVNTITVHE